MLNMRKHLLFSIALGLTIPSYTFAENVNWKTNSIAKKAYSNSLSVQNTIQGVVSDAFGPLPGTTVQVVGKATTTVTDSQGRYSIRASQGETLRFSSVGYKAVDRLIGSNAEVNVTLDFDDNSLEQVVVVGYGAQKKGHLTGAITNVDVSKTFGNRPLADVGRGLQGAVPVLTIQVPSGGVVGSDPILKIRGQIGSVNGSNNPLILVDNVEIPSLQYINPNDVESITVLKDAASASIYGSKAAFGVVLITTKKGATTESTNVTYSNNFVWQSPFKDIDIAGIEGLEYTVDAHENMKQTGPAGGF